MFTPEELEELRRADAEIDENFRLTNEEMQAIRKRDREAVVDRKDHRGKKIAAQQAAYYEANKEKIAAQQAAWFQKNREKWNAYQREYRKRKAASRSGSPKSGR